VARSVADAPIVMVEGLTAVVTVGVTLFTVKLAQAPVKALLLVSPP